MSKSFIDRLNPSKYTSENRSEGRNNDKIFEMSTVYLNIEEEFGFSSTNKVGLCFARVDTDEFDEMLESVKEVVTEKSASINMKTDDHEYQWLIIEDGDYENIVSSMHFIVENFCEHGYYTRLITVVYGFEKDDENAYWIYSFERNAYYPFVPVGDKRRNSSIEFKMKSVFNDALTIDENKTNWYPLWETDNELLSC